MGNNRIVTNAAAGVQQTNQYYPFGMMFAESTNPKVQDYKYNGKELDLMHGLNHYDYSARQYDPARLQFTTRDPHSENYYSWSPYAYVANNPMRYIDPDGRSYTDYVKRDGTYYAGVNDGSDALESIDPLPEVIVYPNDGWTTSTQGGVTRLYYLYDSPLTSQGIVVGEKPLEQVNLEFNVLLTGRLFLNAVSNTTVSTVTEETETTVYRVFGGDARAQGFSWTPTNPNSVINFRNAAGLPSGGASGATNTAEFMIEGTVKVNNIIKSRLALPLDGNIGGLTEYIINPTNVNITKLSVLKP